MLQRFIRTFFTAAGILAAAFALTAPAAAGISAEQSGAGVFLQGLADEAVAVLGDKQISAETRQRAFRNLIRRGFDLPVVGRFVLGRHWRRAGQAERSEFARLFENYIVATYTRRLGYYSGESLKIVGERRINATSVQLSSRIDLGRGSPLRIDWRLSKRSGQWRIIDVVVEGVSLAIVQRAEFNAVIRRGGGRITALLALLEKKTADTNPTRTARN